MAKWGARSAGVDHWWREIVGMTQSSGWLDMCESYAPGGPLSEQSRSWDVCVCQVACPAEGLAAHDRGTWGVDHWVREIMGRACARWRAQQSDLLPMTEKHGRVGQNRVSGLEISPREAITCRGTW